MEQSLPQLILPIKLERSPERLTSLGGLVVVVELARAVGLWEEVDRALEGPKSGRGYQPRQFVQALVWMPHAGGRRLGHRFRPLRLLKTKRMKTTIGALPPVNIFPVPAPATRAAAAHGNLLELSPNPRP
jgi:hypothetical protein